LQGQHHHHMLRAPVCNKCDKVRALRVFASTQTGLCSAIFDSYFGGLATFRPFLLQTGALHRRPADTICVYQHQCGVLLYIGCWGWSIRIYWRM